MKLKTNGFTAGRENRSSHDKLEFGLSSQYGDLTLLNAGDEFRIFSEYDLLQDGLDASVEMERDGTYVPLGYYKTQSWDLKVNEASVKVQLTDMLERLNSIKLNMFNLKEINYAWSDTAVSVLEAVKKLLEIGGLDLDVKFNSNADRQHAEEVVINDIYLEKGTVFEMLKRVLQSAKMRLYADVEREDVTSKLKPVIVLYKMC